jgi:hypothetical protein
VADLLRLLARDDNRGAGLDAELGFLDESAERVGMATVLDCLSATLSRLLPGQQVIRSPDWVEVAFAFLGDWRNRTITSLPLFSRISLVTQARRVSNLGYLPTVALISSRQSSL